MTDASARPDCPNCRHLPDELRLCLVRGGLPLEPDEEEHWRVYDRLWEAKLDVLEHELDYIERFHQSFDSLYRCTECGTYYAGDEENSDEGPGNVGYYRLVDFVRLRDAEAEALLKKPKPGRKRPKKGAREG